MVGDIVLWILALGSLAALAAAFVSPTTRPYAKKYCWIIFVVVGVLVGFVLLRRRPGSNIDEQIKEGKKIAGENTAALDKVLDVAYEQVAQADADLARRKLSSLAEKEKYDAQVSAIQKIDSSFERRKALIKLVQDQA